MRVAVVGAGLGGLCLAQGLRRAGIDVVVYERDDSLNTRPQGYRLHMDARAGLALRDCLPPKLFELFLATCGQPGRQFTVVSRQLRVLRELPVAAETDPDVPETLSTSANRLTLREILLSGLDDRICFGHEFVGYEVADAGVVLRFADGSRAEADVLVGADGVNSPVRRQYLPHAKVRDTGNRCVYGRTPLDERTLPLIPAALKQGFTAIVGGPVGLATGLVQFRQRPEVAAASIAPGVRLSPAGDYLMWAVSGPRRAFGRWNPELSELDPRRLHDVAQDLLHTWHPDLRRLVAHASIEETFLVRVRTSSPVPAWAPSRVTLLGDAIHAMSPARGSGANTALRDAAELNRALTAAASVNDSTVLLSKIGAYEASMRDYGFATVLASQQAERVSLAHRIGGAVLGALDRFRRT